MNVLDKVALLLGLGVDRGTGGGLGLLAGAGGSPRASEHGGQDTEGELKHDR